MTKTGYHILRVGLGITFLWIGIVILRNPEAWSGYIQNWVIEMLPISVNALMISTAIFDIIVGFFILIDLCVWFFALLSALHLVAIIIVSGINEITVRDLSILAGTLTLFAENLPKSIIEKIKSKTRSQ